MPVVLNLHLLSHIFFSKNKILCNIGKSILKSYGSLNPRKSMVYPFNFPYHENRGPTVTVLGAIGLCRLLFKHHNCIMADEKNYFSAKNRSINQTDRAF